MIQTSGLTVRQHEREGIEVPIEFVVCDEYRGQIRFSSDSSALDLHTLPGKAVDISSGGMGLETRQFVPRMCEGIVRVFVPDPTMKMRDGSPMMEKVFEHRVRVRRVYTVRRDPVYALGVAFVNPQPGTEQLITALLKKLPPSNKPPVTTGAKENSHA